MTWDGHMHIDLEPPYLVLKPGMTETDFYRLADEDSNWEYLDGRIVMHSPASNRHEELFSFLHFLVAGCAAARGGFAVRGSRYPMRLDANWSPEPDLLIVANDRRHLMTDQYLDGPADMVIEIASASDPRLDEREKLPRYRDAGIHEMWFVNPFTETLRVETKHAGAYATRLLRNGRLEAAVLSGLWLEVEWLWQEPLPPLLSCLDAVIGR